MAHYPYWNEAEKLISKINQPLNVDVNGMNVPVVDGIVDTSMSMQIAISI